MSSPPPVSKRVLPTLNQDGTRLQIRPRLSKGRIWWRRRAVGWALIALFVSLPFVRVAGKPAVFLDVAERQFVFVGRTFLATDGVLLMFLMLSIFVGIIFLTALVGRAWCGWGCPQTVYMEFLFRPIERLFEGKRNDQLRLDKKGGGIRRVLKNITFLAVSVFVANVFLAYFVGTQRLAKWMTSSPFEQPGGFAVMAVTALLVFFDFAYFREQMCTVICPYARLQAALFDKNSLVIGYDEPRGEPRHKGKPVAGAGDCIDCSACVTTCPTGIDIRKGLQLECIACGQCIDACDSIMEKIHKPTGLVRYASQNNLAGLKSAVLRPRVFAYVAILTGLLTALIFAGQTRANSDVTVLRGIGAPFVLQGETVRNQLRVKIESRAPEDGDFVIEVLIGRGEDAVVPEIAGVSVVNPENPLFVEKGARRVTSLFVVAAKEEFENGQLPVVIRVTDPSGALISTPYVLLGP